MVPYDAYLSKAGGFQDTEPTHLFFTDMEQGMKQSSVFYIFKVDINALVLNLKLHFGQVLKESSKFSNNRVKAAIYKGFPIQTRDFVA